MRVFDESRVDTVVSQPDPPQKNQQMRNRDRETGDFDDDRKSIEDVHIDVRLCVDE